MIYIRFTMGLAWPRDLWIVVQIHFCLDGISKACARARGIASLS